MSNDGGGAPPDNVGLQQSQLADMNRRIGEGGGGDGQLLAGETAARALLGITTAGADGDFANLQKAGSSGFGLSMQQASPINAANGDTLISSVISELVQILNQPIEDQTGGVGGSVHGEGGIEAGAGGGAGGNGEASGGGAAGGGNAASDYGGEPGGAGDGGDTQQRVHSGQFSTGQEMLTNAAHSNYTQKIRGEQSSDVAPSANPAAFKKGGGAAPSR